jgi:hypothetical protein
LVWPRFSLVQRVSEGKGAWSDRVVVHGNTTQALGTLGGQIGSRRRGRGDMHGHARVVLLQGIDPLGRGRSGSEVTAREVDGGVLPRLGIHGGQWRRPWRGRGIAAGLWRGVGLGFLQGWRMLVGGLRRWGDQREGSTGRVASGSSSSPRCQVNRTSEKDFFEDPLTPNRDP